MSNTTDKIVELIKAARSLRFIKNYTSGVILAAGSSTRMGEGSRKQFITLQCENFYKTMVYRQ